MRAFHFLVFAGALLLSSGNVFCQVKDDLDVYIERLRNDYAGPRKETGFLSAGNEFLNGQENFEAKNYSAAVFNFSEVIRYQKDNPYAHYQIAIALLRQNDKYKAQQAEEFLEKALLLNPSLKTRLQKDLPGHKTTVHGTTNPLPDKGPASQESTDGNSRSGLDTYIEKLKYSKSTGGAETAMNTPGWAAISAIEYYLVRDYRGAEGSLKYALAMGADNPWINYMLGVSMSVQGKNLEARPFLEKAFANDLTLKARLNNDLEVATVSWKKSEDANKFATITPAKIVYGGKLLMGNYTCHVSVWNGPNASPAYSYRYEGYFQLRADGTYRWLDDGVTGKYRYDPVTGVVNWLSGHFKNNQKTTLYQVNKNTGQMTVTFTDTYKWECGCKK